MISRYVVREKTINEPLSPEYKFPVLMEQFVLDNGQEIELPSVLNKFTHSKYKKKPVSVAKNQNTTIAQFLNYVKGQVDLGDDAVFVSLREQKISGLNFYHLSSFLNYCIDVCDNVYSTIKQKERRLLEFYGQLNNAGVINVKLKYKMVYDPVEAKNRRVYQVPLDDIQYQVHYPPRKPASNKVVDLQDRDIDLLLSTCEKYVPDILFAVALCIYGGLRKGEVVNLRTNDLRIFDDKNIMVADIKDRPELFKGRLLSESGAKKPRHQVVFNDNGKLYDYYEKHLTYRTKVLHDKNTTTEALFVDTNGNAMTGANYLHRFDKLKECFLKAKEIDEYTEFLRLSHNKWGSHICRGIFTNLCVRRGYARSLEELRSHRGDKHTTSSEPYWNRYTIEIQTQQTINVITSCDKYKNIYF